jgi:hypothetical protein
MGGTDMRDTPYYREGKPVDVNVNVNVKDDRKPRCEHDNHVGECLLCWNKKSRSQAAQR